MDVLDARWTSIKVHFIKTDSIYKFCFKLLTNRQMQAIIIDYNSDIEYFQAKKTLTVPETLLKSSETKAAYERVVLMEQNIDRYQ